MTEQPTPRRWFRFSLRTLLIVVILLSLPLGWLTMKMREAERQRKAVEAIQKAGGTVYYAWETGGDLGVAWEKVPPAPEWLIRLTGKDLFGGIAVVQFHGTEHTDAGLKFLKGQNSVKLLILTDSDITDAGLERIKGLSHLEWLDINGTKVTDAGLKHLRGLTNLRTLYLSHTFVTDGGLEHFKEMTKLQSLDLFGTNITEKGIEELQEALPNCTILNLGWGPPNPNKP